MSPVQSSSTVSIPRAPRRSVTSLAIACAIVLLSGWIPALAARASPLSLLGLAANIHIDPALEDSVGHMLQTSATFCDQCRRLGRIRPLRVDVELVRNPPPSSVRPGRAHTVVNRYEFGGIHAVVRLWSRDETAELIAHEFEHVLECAERVNYRALALLQPGYVWLASGSHYETRRAIEAGLRVARESSVTLATARARR